MKTNLHRDRIVEGLRDILKAAEDGSMPKDKLASALHCVADRITESEKNRVRFQQWKDMGAIIDSVRRATGLDQAFKP